MVDMSHSKRVVGLNPIRPFICGVCMFPSYQHGLISNTSPQRSNKQVWMDGLMDKWTCCEVF